MTIFSRAQYNDQPSNDRNDIWEHYVYLDFSLRWLLKALALNVCVYIHTHAKHQQNELGTIDSLIYVKNKK